MDIEIEEFSSRYKLTPKEREVFHYFIHGKTLFKDIANEINSSHHTVNNHFKNIFRKMQVSSKADLLAMFLNFYAKKCESSLLFNRHPSVLVVDDDDSFCEIISEELTERGIQVFFTTNCDEALKFVHQERIDVALIDVRMPVMNGLDLMNEIKKSHPYYPGVFLITGYFSELDPMDYYKKGAYGLIPKPVNFDELCRQIFHFFRDDKGMSAEDFDQVKSLAPALILRKENVGLGGVYIELDKEIFLEGEKKEVGDVVEFDFCVDGQGKDLIKTKSEIGWLYETPLHDNKVFLGLKFRRMLPEHQRRLEEMAKSERRVSVIPAYPV